jgi:cytidyltransferase-like protein
MRDWRFIPLWSHIFFKKVRQFGEELIVGICAGDHVSADKRRPILNLQERTEVIKNCVLVDEVVTGTPPATDKNFMKLHRIDLVVASTEYPREILKKYYNYPQETGLLKLVDYTDGISTTDIILRCYKAVSEEARHKKFLR